MCIRKISWMYSQRGFERKINKYLGSSIRPGLSSISLRVEPRDSPIQKSVSTPRLGSRPPAKPLFTIMFILLFTLLALATILQDSMLHHFNYYNTGIIPGLSS
ncbi:hypothetical protein FRC08_005360 [Ceratobasidium sp. 394]|nr:hypothetical protein FRC08_005360 [Ceratobasidium sp. 394]